MREIVLDTETTGLDPATGDRVVEIGCVELVNMFPTGQVFHAYLNPERDMPEGAFRVHGLSAGFLADKPLFSAIVDEFERFIEGARIVAHNANFDIRFLNAELARCGRAAIGMDRVVDTLALALRKHPGASNSLDALCQRYGVDTSRRVRHGGLVDAEILAEVYAELTGGRQSALPLAPAVDAGRSDGGSRGIAARPAPLAPLLSAAELAAHAAFVATMGEAAVWRDYAPEETQAEG